IAGMSITDERDQVIDFTQGYILESPSAYVGASADADWSGGIVAAQTSTIQASYIASSGATLVEFATADDTIAAVKNGEADAVLADRDYLTPIVEESGGALVFVGDAVPLGDAVGMGIRESDTELREKFNVAISSMKADGTLNTMIIKWFGPDAPTF
ncbi:MAG: transporter substrate-binding domain-containing protein, partial [Paracoccaceae bacterium]